MIRFDGASWLLQWASGGLLFLWVTTRHGEVGRGYAWLLRGFYGLVAALSAYIGIAVIDPLPVRDVCAVVAAILALGALVAALARRGSGPPDRLRRLDLVAACVGFVGVIAAALDAGGAGWLTVARFVVGAAFVGCVTNTMVLVRFYLVQPGTDRAALRELIRWCQRLVVSEIVVWLVPTGMVSVFSGAIDDGYGGLLGWFWIASALTAVGLLVMVGLAAREPHDGAIMTMTGLMYLVVLTTLGTDLVARALLSLGVGT